MKKNIYILAFIPSFICGCFKESLSDSGEKNSEEVVYDNSFYNIKSVDRYVGDLPGKYVDFYFPTDFSFTMASMKGDPLTDFNYFTEHQTRNRVNTIKAFNTSGSAFDVKVNGEIPETIHTRSNERLELSDYYGTDVYFTIEPEAGTKSDYQQIVGATNLYIPKLISINNPKIVTESDAFPCCYFKDMVVEWEADPKNENGVLIVVEWFGTMAYGYNHPNVYIRTTEFVENDSGKAILNNQCFESIPDAALCHVTILRGAIENIMIEDKYSYKIMAYSLSAMPIILVKNITF